MSKTALTDRELELLGMGSEFRTGVSSEPLQMRPWRCKLCPLFTFIVLVIETPIRSGTSWDWDTRPMRARWKCSFSRSQGWDASPVRPILSKLDPMVVIRKLKRRCLEAFLRQARPPLRPQLAKSVGVATSVVCCDAPTNLHDFTSPPICGHNVPEWKVFCPGSVSIPSKRTIATFPRPRIRWAAKGVSTTNPTPRVHWCSSRCPLIKNRLFLFVKGETDIISLENTPPRVVAEVTKLFLFLLGAACSYSLPEFWQPWTLKNGNF